MLSSLEAKVESNSNSSLFLFDSLYPLFCMFVSIFLSKLQKCNTSISLYIKAAIITIIKTINLKVRTKYEF